MKMYLQLLTVLKAITILWKSKNAYTVVLFPIYSCSNEVGDMKPLPTHPAMLASASRESP